MKGYDIKSVSGGNLGFQTALLICIMRLRFELISYLIKILSHDSTCDMAIVFEL